MNRWKLYIFFMLFVGIEAIVGVQMITKQTTVDVDVALVNDLRHQLNMENVNYEEVQKKITYAFNVVNQQGDLLFVGSDDVPKTMHEAWMQHAIVIELDSNDWLFIQDQSVLQQQLEQTQRFTFFCGFLLLQLLGFIIFVEWFQHRFFTPFIKLQSFAQRITEGHLDEPLQVDKYQNFGAFSEGFDMMRIALKEAKRQETLATQSKKELVAKLSHDIKTPIATIKAISELMQVQTSSTKEKDQLAVILAKLDQMDALVSNLFHATLEELEQLQVQNTIQSSSNLRSLFEQVDYANRVHMVSMEDVLITYDTLRLSQVIDNIISNAYKYANGEIDVIGKQEQDVFQVVIQDHGGGISLQDIKHIQEKFYRGKNALHESGSGLGLYISTYFMHAMQGDIRIENKLDGLCITLILSICKN